MTDEKRREASLSPEDAREIARMIAEELNVHRLCVVQGGKKRELYRRRECP